MRRGHVLRRSAGARAIGVVAAIVAASITTVGAAAATTHAATPTFSAHGSAEQVYVTGPEPNVRMSLITPQGTTLYTRQADSLGGGGLLFRNVPPGNGYRVRPYPAGVQSRRASPGCRSACRCRLACRACPGCRLRRCR